MFTLTRTEHRPDGIFGVLTDVQGNVLAHTLEHSYDVGGKWTPKIPNGTFTCVRGPHRLHNMDHDFETFEITGVPGHEGLLLHWGNWNRDSEGCLLLGRAEISLNGQHMVTASRDTFAKFMQLNDGIDTFQLLVK